MADIADLVVCVAVAFLAGFKIGVWMERRHIDRLKKIWRPDQDVTR